MTKIRYLFCINETKHLTLPNLAPFILSRIIGNLSVGHTKKAGPLPVLPSCIFGIPCRVIPEIKLYREYMEIILFGTGHVFWHPILGNLVSPIGERIEYRCALNDIFPNSLSFFGHFKYTARI